MMRARWFLIVLLIFVGFHAFAVEQKSDRIVVIYNHGTSDRNNCGILGIGREFPDWVKRLDGQRIADLDVQVEFFCLNTDPDSYDTVETSCKLNVCKRAEAISKRIEHYVNDRGYSRRHIFLAGQ